MAKDTNGKELPKGIIQKRDGRYEGRFQYKGDKYWVVDKKLKICQKKLADLRYEVEHGLFIKEENITLTNWFDIWIKEYKEFMAKDLTIKTYKHMFTSHIKEPFGKKKLKDIRPEMVQALYNDLKRQSYSSKTIEIVSVVLNGMYKQALRNRIIRENPIPLATIPKIERKKEQRVMTVEEQKLFLTYAKDNECFELMELALATGMRSGELRALEWSDIDFENKIIHVNGTLVYLNARYYKGTPKTFTSKRDIPMLQNVYYLLKQTKVKQAEARLELGEKWKPIEGLEDLVFSTKIGAPIASYKLKKEINCIIQKIEKAGIEFMYITPHIFRHTFATRCIENGMSPQVLKTILGHSQLSMTMDLYSHVLPNIKAEEMQKISNLF